VIAPGSGGAVVVGLLVPFTLKLASDNFGVGCGRRIYISGGEFR
jgi:hypothetical protein